MSSITNLPQNLKVDVKLSNVINVIVEKVKEIPQYDSLSKDIGIILFVANSIENECFKKKYNIDKMKLACDILITLFPNTNDNEKLVIQRHIQFLFDNKLIKKLSTFILFYRSLKTYLKKKLL